jgi:hypothetical protein
MARRIDTSEENLLYEMHGMLNQLCGEFKSHIKNQAIHQNPPCEAHKSLSARLWAIGTLAVTALVGVAYNAVKGH